MYNNRPRRRKFRSNNKIFRRRHNGDGLRNHGTNIMLNGQIRPNSLRGNHNAHKLIEKYNSLAKEALSAGDKILSENYLQHADHFSRIATNNSNANQNKTNDSNFVKDLNLKNETTTSNEDNIQNDKSTDNTVELKDK